MKRDTKIFLELEEQERGKNSLGQVTSQLASDAVATEDDNLR